MNMNLGEEVSQSNEIRVFPYFYRASFLFFILCCFILFLESILIGFNVAHNFSLA